MPESQIVDNPSLHRFELNQDGSIAFVLYTKSGDTLRLVHTEVPESMQGKGVGSRLVGGILRHAQQQGFTVIPSCPFVADYLKRHPEYLAIVDAAHRRLIESGQ